MTNYNFRKLIMAVAAVFLLFLTVWSGSRFLAGSSGAVRRNDSNVDAVKEIAGYRSWTRVNTEPQLMEMQTAQLCAAVRPISTNDVGLRASSSSARFKTGSDCGHNCSPCNDSAIRLSVAGSFARSIAFS